MTKISKKKF